METESPYAQELAALAQRAAKLQTNVASQKAYTDLGPIIAKFDTQGEPLDFENLSDQDLRDMFDVGRANSTLNEVDNVEMGHRHGSVSISENGITSARGPDSVGAAAVPASREYLEEVVGTWMNVKNNQFNPRDLMTAQMNVAASPGLVLGGDAETLKFDYINLQEKIKEETGVDFKDPALEQQLKEIKTAVEGFDRAEKQLKADIAQRAPRAGLEFAAKMGFNADKVAREARDGFEMDVTRKADIRGANIKGLDLSKTDLSNFEVDAQTLSRAEGLDTVKGISDDMRAEAKAMKPFTERMDQLQERKAKLESDPSLGDRFKAFFKHGPGGLKSELKSLDKKLEATETAMVRVVNEGQSLEKQQEKVNDIKKADQKLARDIAVAHNAGGQLAAGNALQVKSADEYSADEKKLGKLAAKEESLKEQRESVKDALKKETRVLKAMEKVDAPQVSQSSSPKL